MVGMEEPYNAPESSSYGFGILNVIFVLIGLIVIYYMYRFLYTSSETQKASTTLINGQESAAIHPNLFTNIPPPFEGGEYSVNTWAYISSYNKNMNTRKHLLEIKGQYFSTLLIALGAFKNTLTVRTQSDSVLEGFTNSGSGSGTTTPNSANTGSLSSSGVDALFAPMSMDDAILNTPPVCDLPEIDLQRWTMITVVLSGRTIDVYLDGKLARSCNSPSYYKVDPTGVAISLLDRGGFDGYIGNTMVGAYAMNPDEIYRAYLSGPTGPSMNIFSWAESFFRGAKV
jgi:hypothetical protein